MAYPTWRTAIMQNWCALEKGYGAVYAHEKAIFLSFCQCTHGVAHQLSWPHDTLQCVLIWYTHIIMHNVQNVQTNYQGDYMDATYHP